MKKQISESVNKQTSESISFILPLNRLPCTKACIKGRMEVGQNSSDSWKGDSFQSLRRNQEAKRPAEMQSDLGLNYGSRARVFKEQQTHV